MYGNIYTTLFSVKTPHIPATVTVNKFVGFLFYSTQTYTYNLK